MKIDVITEKRRFNLRNLSELEGCVLRTIVNINDEGLRRSLLGDENYWNDEVTIDEALEVAIEIRDKIFRAVDGHE